MRTPQSRTAREDPASRSSLHDLPLPVQAKLAAAWTNFMFLYVYVDILALPARANRITNLVVASVQVPFAALDAVREVGEPLRTPQRS